MNTSITPADAAAIATALFGRAIPIGITPEEKAAQEKALAPYMRGTRSPW